ncbi:MAG: S24 family peptidase [Candidatus Peribacteria bacterium]|nr:S24 family peptidase [Candidatus Peribacteria bacterium]
MFIVNGAATLKKYKKDGNNIYLLPESQDSYHKPIILDESDNIMVN